MNAIPKAIAMANPKHVAACVASVAVVISSKFAIDAVANEIDDTSPYEDGIEFKRILEEKKKCRQAYL